MFGPKKDVNEEWRRLHGEELRVFNIVRVIKCRHSRWPGHVARMKECNGAFKILTSTPAINRILGKPRRNERVILEWILKK
jgi:hypothetical protein